MSGFLCSMVGATFSVAAAAEVLRSKNGVVAYGAAQIDTAQSKFGGSSALFDGAGDGLLISSTAPFDFGTGNFTIEFWMRKTSYSGGDFFLIEGNSDLAANIYWYYGASYGLYLYHAGAARITTDVGSFSANTWHHIALVKNNSVTRFYVDGTQRGSDYSDTTSYSFPNGVRIADENGGNGRDFGGWLDEIRISKTARYTTTFTPSTTPFVNDDNTVLLIHANGTDGTTFFEDDNGGRSPNGLFQQNTAAISTTQSKFGGSSLSLNGTSSVNTPTAFAFGTGDFTVEYWVRPTTLSSYDIHWDLRGSNTSQLSPIVYTNGTTLYMDAGATTRITGSTLSTATWYHIALSRASGSTKLFVNGTQVGSTYADTNSYLAATPLYIGMSQSGSGVDGYMDEFRISNSARYTANFTAPTTPFVNDANTLLLCHFDGTNGSTVFRDDNGALAATATGTAVTFDGTGDYYSATGITTSATDSKYLLLVCTFYWAGGNNLQHIADLRLGTGGSEVGFYSWINGGRSQITLVGGGSEFKTMYEDAENSLTSGAWNQIVFYMQTDSTANSRIYINGISRAFTNSNQNLTTLNWGNAATTITIGQKQAAITGTGEDFNGRMAQVYIHNPTSFPGIEAFWASGPRDLGTTGTATGLAQPLIYHYGNNDTFRTNNGTGFASYTLTANGNAGTATANLPTFYSPRRQQGVISNGSAAVSTTQSKFGGTSLYLNGTSQFLTSPGASNTAFTTEDFTIEAWIYPISSTGNFITNLDNGTNNGWQFAHWSTGRLLFCSNSTSGTPGIDVRFSSDNAYTLNTWNHIAVCRTGGTLTMYANGNRVYSATGLPTLKAAAAGLRIGQSNGIADGLWQDPGNYSNSYANEIRISNTVRYTGTTYTQPTGPFQNDANTLLLLHNNGTNGSTAFFDDNGAKPYTP